MKKTTTREKGSKCPSCSKHIEVGQVILNYDDAGEMHANCDNPFSLKVLTTSDEPQPMVLLDSPMRHIPLSVITNPPKNKNQELLTASTEALHAFSEGVVWNNEQRVSYNNLNNAVNRFSPTLAKFQPAVVN